MLERDHIQLGEFVFDVGTRDLRDSRGNRVELQNKPSEVLACLASRPGDIVAKSDIMNTIWADVSVSDESLTQCVALIRRALGDKDQKILRTHVGKGYSLSVAGVPPADRVGKYRLLVAALVVFAAAAAAIWYMRPAPDTNRPPRIAVLAFDDLSAGEDKGYLSDGVAEGLTTELARYKSFKVIARNSSFKFRDSAASIPEIAKELRADFVVEGSKQKFGNRLRVAVQLIDGQDGTHMWAHSFDADIGELFDVQSKIVQSITHQIGEEVRFLPVPEGGRDRVSALHYFKLGMQEFRVGGQAKTLAAQKIFQKAIDVDPDAPFGYVGMSWVHWRDSFSNILDTGAPHNERVRLAADFAAKAMELDPAFHLAHVARADAHVAAGELEEAVTRFRIAAELNPNDALVLAAMSDPLVFMGEAEEAIALLERAIDLAPITPAWYYWQLGWAQWSIGRCDEGLASMQLMSKTKAMALRVIAALHVCSGDIEAAREEMAKFIELRPDHSVSDDIANFKQSWRNPETMDRWAEAMRLAGMPES